MGAEWVCILVGVVAVGILVLGGVLRGMAQSQEEERKRQLQRRQRPLARPGPASPQRPPATSGNELDRFLQEVQRRKQGVAPPAAEPPPPVAPPVAKPVEQRPRQATERPRPAAPAPRRPRTEKPSPRPRTSRRQEEEAEVLPVMEVIEDRPNKPKWEPQTAGPKDAAGPTDAAAAVTAERAYRSAPVTTGPTKVLPAPVIQLREFLKNQQTLRAAMMLKEVLGPPKCKR